MADRWAILAAKMPDDLERKVEEFAKARSMSKSSAICCLIRMGFTLLQMQRRDRAEGAKQVVSTYGRASENRF